MAESKFSKWLGEAKIKGKALAKKAGKYILMLGKILVWYFFPALLTLFVAILASLLIHNHLVHQFDKCGKEWSLFDFNFLFKDTLTTFHTVGIYASLIGQIAVANFYSANGYFDAVKLKNFFLESIGVCLPVFTTCAVMVSTICVYNHQIQEYSNWIYLFLIVIWDVLYSYAIKGDNTKLMYKRCKRFTKGLLRSDFVYLALFLIIYLVSKQVPSEDANSFLAGGYSIIFCLIVLNLIRELIKWEIIQTANITTVEQNED